MRSVKGWASGVVVGVVFASSAIAAEPLDAAVKAQFAQGVRLFDAEGYAQALTLFEAVWTRTQAPAVRFNLAMTHAQLGQPVEAVAQFDALLAAPGSFPPERLARARTLRDQQAALIGHLTLDTPVAALVVEVDGRSHAVAPGEAVPVNPGQRFVTVLAQGHLPWREAVAVAAGSTQALTPKLVRSELRPAQVRVVCPLADVEVRVDGRAVGLTPLLAALELSPGAHALSAHRDGYRPISVGLDLAEGARESLRFDPQPDAAAPATGTLTVRASENQAVIAVDGQPVGAAGTLAIAHGRHQLVVRRDGFFEVLREVQVPLGQERAIDVRLEPTPEYRGQLQRTVDQRRFWGVTGVAVGAATLGAGIAAVAVNRGPYVAAVREYDSALAAYTASKDAASAARLGRIAPVVTEKETIQTAGIVTLGVGAAFAAAGLVTLLTAPDLSRYDARPASGALAPISSLEVGVGPLSVAVRGAF